MNLRVMTPEGHEVTSEMTFVVGGLAQSAEQLANLLEAQDA